MADLSKGLTTAQAADLRKAYGPNQIEEKRENVWKTVFRSFLSPITFMLLAAAGLSLAAGRLFDCYFILILLAINVAMSLWHEKKADNALQELRAKLTVSARVLRDGAWTSIDSKELVPGDVVECSVGDLVPADLAIKEAKNLQLNEAILTGESLPKEKKEGDTAYSGSSVTSGLARGVVSATGTKTFFGKIIGSVESSGKRSSMERDILSISKYLMVASLCAVAVLTFVLLREHKDTLDILLLDLSLLIAGLPVSLPTVMTLIVSLGAVALARKEALVRRLAALEDLANVNLLLTDKTGTLTESTIVLERIHAYAPYSEEEVLRLSAAGAAQSVRNLLDKAIATAAKEKGLPILSVGDFTPGDSLRKRTTALVEDGGKRWLVSTGTPPILETLANLSSEQKEKLDADIAAAARDGSRVLGVTIKENPAGGSDEKDMAFAGLLVLSDPLRKDAPQVVTFLEEQGIQVKMMTGDTKETARRVADILHLSGEIADRKETNFETMNADAIARVSAFAEVFPDDKLALVRAAQKRWTVAVTGDGINDLPAVKRADVGIAVANAVDALKGTADIVLLAPGIGIVQNALIEARRIFFRLYSYSVYRISESVRLVVTVLVLGFLYADFPLTPVQLILLALLNDIPIITLAFNRVKNTERPAEIPLRKRYIMGTLFGLVGIAESLLLFFFLFSWLHLPWSYVQSAFFLKLTVSGHMLIYVVHTKERWWRFLPSKSVIWATTLTQLAATSFAFFGFFIGAIPLYLIGLVWVWVFVWMQVAELAKIFGEKLTAHFS